jgi:hypothetical protein
MVSDEADVVRATALYLLHPVHMALTARHPDVSIQCLAEFASSGIRPDIVYKKDGQNFALLEYKVTGVVNRQEFTTARLAATALPNEVTAKRVRAENKDDGTFFYGNALKIIKRMACYSAKDETQYIAMFNWDWLFLSIFNSDKDIVHGTLVDRAGSQKNQLRKAFLGWLLEAYGNNGKSTLNAPDRT